MKSLQKVYSLKKKVSDTDFYDDVPSLLTVELVKLVTRSNLSECAQASVLKQYFTNLITYISVLEKIEEVN